MKLHLFDMSNFIYTGIAMKDCIQRGVREVDGFWEANSLPIGPLVYFFNFIKGVDYTKNVVVPIFDRVPEKKRQLYTDVLGTEQSYKGTRVKKNNHVTLYSKMLEWALNECGFSCQHADGYEADDIIHTIVNRKKSEYEKVYIYTLDSDLSYLVSDNVEIKKPNSLGKNIDIDNYAYTVRKDRVTYYNTIHIHKLIEGDKSDNIPGIGQQWNRLIAEQVLPGEYAELGDLDRTREVLLRTIKANPTEKNAHLVLSIFKIITPFTLGEDELDTDFFSTSIDYEKLMYFKHGMRKEDDLWGFENNVLEWIDQYNLEQDSDVHPNIPKPEYSSELLNQYGSTIAD